MKKRKRTKIRIRSRATEAARDTEFFGQITGTVTHVSAKEVEKEKEREREREKDLEGGR